MVQEYVEGDDAQIYVTLCYRARSAPQVREMTRRLAKTAGARGAFCTEFKLDAHDGRYYFIEWNPRPAYFQADLRNLSKAPRRRGVRTSAPPNGRCSRWTTLRRGASRCASSPLGVQT
jgi:hypothetical protein